MKIWHYGDHINTDMLFPGKYTYTCSTPDEIRSHLLEDLDPSFAKEVAPGDVILAGENFGCGSSREQPVVGLKAVGIQAIIAGSFGRIFYRSAINQGLVLIEGPQVVSCWAKGQRGPLIIADGKITLGEKSWSFPPRPREILAIGKAGGLLEYTRAKLKRS